MKLKRDRGWQTTDGRFVLFRSGGKWSTYPHPSSSTRTADSVVGNDIYGQTRQATLDVLNQVLVKEGLQPVPTTLNHVVSDWFAEYRGYEWLLIKTDDGWVIRPHSMPSSAREAYIADFSKYAYAPTIREARAMLTSWADEYYRHTPHTVYALGQIVPTATKTISMTQSDMVHMKAQIYQHPFHNGQNTIQ